MKVILKSKIIGAVGNLFRPTVANFKTTYGI